MPAAARSTFHCNKSHARKALGRPLVVYEDGLYKIARDPDCWFDVEVFVALLDEQGGNRQARLEKAVSLYQGDFLQGYDAEWCRSMREQLRMRYRDALLELGKLLMKKRKNANAFSVLNRVATLDNLYEPAIRALMRFYVRDGQPHSARDVFHQLERRLQNMRSFPGQKTQSLYRSIQARPWPAP